MSGKALQHERPCLGIVEEFPDQFGAFLLGDDVAEAFDVHLGDSVPRCMPRVFAHAFRVGVAAARRRLCSAHKGWRFTVCLAGEKERAGMPGWNGPGPPTSRAIPNTRREGERACGACTEASLSQGFWSCCSGDQIAEAGETNPQ